MPVSISRMVTVAFVRAPNPSAGATLGARTNATVTILEIDTGIQVEFSKYSVNEDAGALAIAITRGPDDNFAASVDYATTNLTATAGQDYLEAKGTLQFATNERRKLVSVPILNDALKESGKTFGFTLSNPTGPTALGKVK